MSDPPRPPPYRRRKPDPEIPLDEDPKAQDARLRRELLRAVVVTLVVGVVAAFVLMLRYLPGGGMAYVLPSDWMLFGILALTVVLMARRDWRRRIGRLLILLVGLAILSLIGILFSLFYGPSLIRH